MQVLPARVIGLEISRALVRQNGLVRRPEIGRASEKPGDVLRQNVQHLARGVAPRDAFRVGREDGKVAVPPGREFAPLHLVDLGGERPDTWLDKLRTVPSICASGFCAACADAGSEVLIDAVGHKELRVLRPAVEALA